MRRRKVSMPLTTDQSAESSSPDLPAFLSRPEGAPVYHGFPLIPETETDGWTYGAITDPIDDLGCEGGDGYVVAPDGSRAGLVWEVGNIDFSEVCEPTPARWGVYSVGFLRPIRSIDDLIANFRHILPALKAKHEEIRSR
jgi:hypothetical protein